VSTDSKKIASSPERHTFQQDGYIKRCEEEGKEPNPDYVNMYKTCREQDEANLVDPEWKKNNLEYDLRSTQWICDKVKAYDNYAQNIYAALCNMQWCNIKGADPKVTLDILKEKYWSCSWRHAGGIVADMQEKGDYIDWYCSGIGNEEMGNGLDGTKPVLDEDGRTYVPEGIVTDEIELDLKKLGWIPVEFPENE
jgi:hypothetical protein